MSDGGLFGLVGGLVTKVATKTEDGLQRFANKTEDVAKRVNRTVNPLSSHFRESSSASPDHLRLGDHAPHSNPLAFAQSPYVDRALRSDAASRAPLGHPSQGYSSDCVRHRDAIAVPAEPPTILKEGLSSKSALMVADEILKVVTFETTKLEAERDQYRDILDQLQQLRKEQEEAYKRTEALLDECDSR